VPWPKVFERKEDVRAFYTSSDKATRNRILQRYGVRYVVCGPLERQEYGPENVARIVDDLPPVFRSGSGESRVVICLAVQSR
jgi:uncharacterized membrane protein